MLNGVCGRATRVAGVINNNLRAIRGKSTNFWSWSKEKKNDADKIKIIKPPKMDCTEHNRQILDPECKVAIVLGGTADMGLSAADSLLYHGARSNTARAINTGMKYLGLRDKKKDAGIIVNCASIIGFMGWPEDPVPIYCFNKEPVAETTMDLAKMYSVEKTGVRIVAILKSHRPFTEIALPDFPTSNSKMHRNDPLSTQCEPSPESRIGKALTHVMARAPTGTVWLSEPAPCAREIPWQIHFPPHQGESADLRIYEKQMQNYSNPIEPSRQPGGP